MGRIRTTLTVMTALTAAMVLATPLSSEPQTYTGSKIAVRDTHKPTAHLASRAAFDISKAVQLSARGETPTATTDEQLHLALSLSGDKASHLEARAMTWGGNRGQVHAIHARSPMKNFFNKYFGECYACARPPGSARVQPEPTPANTPASPTSPKWFPSPFVTPRQRKPTATPASPDQKSSASPRKAEPKPETTPSPKGTKAGKWWRINRAPKEQTPSEKKTRAGPPPPVPQPVRTGGRRTQVVGMNPSMAAAKPDRMKPDLHQSRLWSGNVSFRAAWIRAQEAEAKAQREAQIQAETKAQETPAREENKRSRKFQSGNVSFREAWSKAQAEMPEVNEEAPARAAEARVHTPAAKPQTDNNQPRTGLGAGDKTIRTVMDRVEAEKKAHEAARARVLERNRANEKAELVSDDALSGVVSRLQAYNRQHEIARARVQAQERANEEARPTRVRFQMPAARSHAFGGGNLGGMGQCTMAGIACA